MKHETAAPRIASYVIIKKDGKIAFVLRENTTWMNDYYGLPSGKVEQNEPFSVGAAREALEEIGIAVLPEELRFIHVMHRYGNNDWVDVYFEADTWEGTPFNAEPHLHSELAWLDPNDLPENVIPPVRYALDQIKAGKQFSEYGW